MAQTTEMKKRKFTKVFALLLAMVMVLALPVEASAAAKVTAVTKETKAKAVKIYMTGKAFNIKIKTASGKTGWVKGSRKFSDKSLLFKECFYAG